jgi:hypothetical protein
LVAVVVGGLGERVVQVIISAAVVVEPLALC